MPSEPPVSESGIVPYEGPKFPDRTFTVIFADAVYSLAQGNGLVKFYLARLDPSIIGDGSSQMVPFAQVVMPVKAFVTTALFFDSQIQSLINNGQITREEIDMIRNAFVK
jgi:hypothetical protein